MSTTDTSTAQNVYFKGPWDENDQQRIADAVADFEECRIDENLFSESPSWVCVAYEIGPSSLFCAHRPHLSNVLSAATPHELADAIRNASY